LEDRHVNRRLVLVSGWLLAFLFAATVVGAAEPDCSNQRPPAGAIQVTGPQIRLGERLIAAPGARIEVVATDAAGQPATWTPVVEGREATDWPGPWTAGGHSAGAIVVDSCGRRASLAPVSFVVDTEPPALRWELGDRKMFMDSNRLSPDPEKKRRSVRFARSHGRPAGDSWLSEAGVWQIPLPWVQNPDKTFLARAQYPVRIASEHPQAFLAAPGTTAALEGSDSTLGERLLWISAEDAGAGVETLTFRLKNDKDRAAQGMDVLEVVAIDNVGNTSRKEIVLKRAAQKAR